MIFLQLVLLSFFFLAVRYYLEIFKNLYPKYLNGDKKGFRYSGKLTNDWLRFCTFYWPLPILFAFYNGGQWWLYVAFLGTGIVQ